MIEQHHGQRIRLLARRTSGAPDANRLRTDPGRRGDLPARNEIGAQHFEMARLTKERRLVRADGIEHRRPLFGVSARSHDLEVVAERRQAETPQAPRQTGEEQGALDFAEGNSDLALDEDSKLRKFHIVRRSHPRLAERFVRTDRRGGGYAGTHRRAVPPSFPLRRRVGAAGALELSAVDPSRRRVTARISSGARMRVRSSTRT